MKLVAIHAAVLVASLSYSEGFKILEDSGPSKTAAKPRDDPKGSKGKEDPKEAAATTATAATITTTTATTTTTTTTITTTIFPIRGKKGIALEYPTAAALSALEVSWFYNWGAMNDVPGTSVQYVPMILDAASLARLRDRTLGQVILGFNEPDKGNMTPQAALDLWPKVTSLLSPDVKTWLGAPAPARDPTVAANTWLPTFLAGKPTGQNTTPKVDFITMHWYKGVDTELFKKDVVALYNKYQLPIWITEFCPQSYSDAMANPMLTHRTRSLASSKP